MGEESAGAPTSSTDPRKPSLIAFDMDYTLWPFHADTNPYPPLRLDKDGKIRDRMNAVFAPYPGVGDFLEELHEQGTNLALVSRTEAPPVGKDMIRYLNWTRFFKYQEIYPGKKTTHFHKIRKDSGVEFKDMLFFDDEYRNIRDISALGVTCFYVEEPMSRSLLNKAKIDQLTTLCCNSQSTGSNGPCKITETATKCSKKSNPCEPAKLSAFDELILDGLDRYAVIGELLFQFERRVFTCVVPKCQRFYGYAVRNIDQLIAREDSGLDRAEFRCNLSKLNNKLRPFGYLPYFHSELSCAIINEYGVLARSASEIRAMSTRLENTPFLRRLICATIPSNLLSDVLVLFDCLLYLCDGGKVFCY
ncbi:uncharacterized protein LOC129601640 [Paramacrobiotus metropolitanus]|uniref:uncharacterized protein LOC129601640 n=1 Tax=Paramacrobiotus metropolitanus TaxID=2943436 RepID=UPI0024463434|nr:uncharacterized protein LOC129601640 [Paramacrobiotus metropolitanus]